MHLQKRVNIILSLNNNVSRHKAKVMAANKMMVWRSHGSWNRREVGWISTMVFNENLGDHLPIFLMNAFRFQR
jgi:hypothetical protein